MSYTADLVGMEAAMDEGGGTWLADVGGVFNDFARDGLNIWRDYLTIEAMGNAQIPAAQNPNNYVERNYTQPEQPTATPTTTAAAVTGQWVPGVSNSVVLLGGAAILLIALKG